MGRRAAPQPTSLRYPDTEPEVRDEQKQQPAPVAVKKSTAEEKLAAVCVDSTRNEVGASERYEVDGIKFRFYQAYDDPGVYQLGAEKFATAEEIVAAVEARIGHAIVVPEPEPVVEEKPERPHRRMTAFDREAADRIAERERRNNLAARGIKPAPVPLSAYTPERSEYDEPSRHHAEASSPWKAQGSSINDDEDAG